MRELAILVQGVVDVQRYKLHRLYLFSGRISSKDMNADIGEQDSSCVRGKLEPLLLQLCKYKVT